LLASVAGERVLAELEKLAAAPQGHQGLGDCLQLGLLQPWAAEPSGYQALARLDVASATARGLDTAEHAWALPLARLACLLDHQGLMALRSSRRLQQRCHTLRQWLERRSWGLEAAGPGEGASNPLSEQDQLQYHQDLEADLPAMALFLPEAAARNALERWRNPADPLFHPRPPVDGETLQRELGLAPGKQLGALLRHLTLERAMGRLPEPTMPNAVLAAARCWIDDAQHRRRD
jgi:tRNA nucleotidyltransferase (CCA-adding enzyme)